MGLKDYKIVWFTEGGWQGKVSLDNPNMRNDVSTKWLLGAEHYPIFQMPQVLEHFGEKYFDFGIVTLPKTHVDKLMTFDMMGDLKKLCRKTISMQEGPHWYYQDYTMEQQIWWYNSLTEFDMLFAHNHKDVNYYRGITNKPVHKMPTLLLADRLGILPRSEWGDAVVIGGNMVRWYGGFVKSFKMKCVNMWDLAMTISDKIEVVGKRPGEKTDEDLVSENEVNRTFLYGDDIHIRMEENEQDNKLTEPYNSKSAEMMTEEEMEELVWI